MTPRRVLALLFIAACGGSTPTSVPTVHRTSASTCSPSTTNGSCTFTSRGDGNCLTNADCTSGTAGICEDAFGPFCECTYDGCHTDADCKSDEVCACQGTRAGTDTSAPSRNACVSAGCHTDADCGSGQYCGATYDFGCGPTGGMVTYACTTTKDECRTDADCTHLGDAGHAPYCAYDPTIARWACNAAICAR